MFVFQQENACHSLPYYAVFREIEKLLLNQNPIVIAIDGPSGSGKSTLAEVLEANYACQVVSMDHFFLKPEQRTAGRLGEPGGNIDYERFLEQVIPNLKAGNSFSYGVYDCGENAIVRENIIEPHILTVIEGSYSHHPKLSAIYDLKVFLDISPERQRERLLKRNGPKMLERFLNEWIPLENTYFSAFKIEEKSDVIITTHKGDS